MSAIEHLRPIIHTQIYVNSNDNSKNVHRFSFLRDQFRVFHKKPSFFVANSVSPIWPVNLYRQARVSKNPEGFHLWGGLMKNRGSRDSRIDSRIRANSSCEHDSDSKRNSGEIEKSDTKGSESKGVSKNSPASTSSSKNSSRREKQGKGNWWWKGGKWRWQPIIQAQEIGILLLQLGIVMFVMRLLRPGIPLPGSEPRAPTTFVSVPYSDFLSKINSNQVHKVEVDGVHIMFKLKGEPVSLESEGGSANKLQDSELLLRSVAPTKRIVYTTTRPTDIKTPYEKMLENDVEFGSPDKRSGGFLNSALVISVLVVFVLLKIGFKSGILNLCYLLMPSVLVSL